jgi:alanyl aminopeptidase
MDTDARLSTHAIRQPVDAFANFDRLFDSLAYQKGQAVLGMLENWLGPEVFRRGILAYLKEHEWKNATAGDLWRALSAASGQDVRGVTTSFLDQGGVPLVSLETLPGGKVRLQQRRFLNYGVEAPNPTSWKIPVVLRYSDGRQTYTQSVLLADAEQTVTLERTTSPAWVHPDADERGYYRWWVPSAMLQAIADHAAQLTPRERVGLLSNAAALLDAGLLHGDEFMRMLAQFANDPQPEVVSAVLDGLDKVNVTFITPATAAPFAVTVRTMLRPALKRYGIAKARGEAEAVSLMRPNLLSTLGAYGWEPEVLAWARVTARRYLDHPDSVDVSVAGTALNLAARDGSVELFEEYRTRFETAKIPSERSRYLTALGKFRNGGLVDRALDYALTGPLRPHEIFTIPRALTEDQTLRERGWVWLRTSYRTIVRKIPPFYMPALPSFADCCRKDWVEQVKEFFNYPETNYPGTHEELAKVIDSVNDCTGLKEREELSVTRYLLDPGAGRRVSGVTPSP